MAEARDEEMRWTIWRQDDHGNRFEVARGLSAAEASREIARLEASGHKQTYWMEPTR
jgi:hypothetical protein